jgi:Bacterial Ig-like domain (group 3)
MSDLIQNIYWLLFVRIKRDQFSFIRASRVFCILLLLSLGKNGEAQMVTTTSLISTPSNSCLNQPVTLTATIDEPSATGNVLFLEGTTVLGIAPLNASGIAILTLSDLSAGEHSIVAEYEGAAPFDGSTSAEIIHIVNTPPAITTPNSFFRMQCYFLGNS